MTKVIDIKVPPELWASSIMPEGIVEKWLRPNGSTINAGEPIAVVRIESGLHELLAPASGILQTNCQVNGVVDPGFVIGGVLACCDA